MGAGPTPRGDRIKVRRTYWTRRHAQLASEARRRQRKLSLEIAELQVAPGRLRLQIGLNLIPGLLSVAATIAIFVAGSIVQRQIQENAKTQLQADNYARLLRDFGTSNSAVRIGAANG